MSTQIKYETPRRYQVAMEKESSSSDAAFNVVALATDEN